MLVHGVNQPLLLQIGGEAYQLLKALRSTKTGRTSTDNENVDVAKTTRALAAFLGNGRAAQLSTKGINSWASRRLTCQPFCVLYRMGGEFARRWGESNLESWMDSNQENGRDRVSKSKGMLECKEF